MPRRSLVNMGFADREVNLAAIAQQLGISASTVSRALRNIPGIHPKTRENVIRVAMELGYPIASQREEQGALRNILTLSQGGGFEADGAYQAGISRASVGLNLSIISHHFRNDECENVLDPRWQPRALKAHTVQGIILMHRWPDHVVAKLSAKLPVVSIVHDYAEAPVDVIGIDEAGGMRALVRHFIEKGYKKIGLFGYCREMSWARARYGAYVEALAYNELNFDPSMVVPVTFEDALSPTGFGERDSLKRVLELRKSGVEAWICTSEGTAFSLHQYVLSKGLRFPDDIAFAAFHSNQTPSIGVPLFTTVASPTDELGSAALRRVVTRVENREESRRIILLPCSLVVGQTT